MMPQGARVSRPHRRTRPHLWETLPESWKEPGRLSPVIPAPAQEADGTGESRFGLQDRHLAEEAASG